MTSTISSVCPKCGTIEKSGKISCCGHGGSWFGNCGSAGNAKLDHTWYEGIQACKTRSRFKAAIDRQSNAAQQLNPSNGAGMTSFTLITPATTFTFMFTNTSTPMLGKVPINSTVSTPANVSINKSTAPSENTSAEYDTDKANSKTALVITVLGFYSVVQ